MLNVAAAPLQTVAEVTSILGDNGESINTVLVIEHPCASVTLTLSVPAHKPVADDVVCPLFHR